MVRKEFQSIWPNFLSLILTCASKNLDFLGLPWNFYCIGCIARVVDDEVMMNPAFTKWGVKI